MTQIQLLKKTASILLITILLVNTAGLYLFFMAKRMALKKEIRAAIASGTIQNEASVFYFADNTTDAANPAWEGENEFEWKGEMYDVIRKTRYANGVQVLAIRDEQEEKLLDKYNDWIKDNTSNSSKKNTALVKLITATFILPCIKQATIRIQGTPLVFQQLISKIAEGYYQLPSQPPRSAS